jgi:hypothetical protein
VVGTVAIGTELGHRYRRRWIGRLNLNPLPMAVTEPASCLIGLGKVRTAVILCYIKDNSWTEE